MAKLPELIIGNLKISPPIIQGGMGVRISLANLASAIANLGGVGTISTALIGGALSHDSIDEHETADIRELTYQIRKAKTLTTGILAVKVMVDDFLNIGFFPNLLFSFFLFLHTFLL